MSDLIKTLKSSETGNDVYPNIKEENIPDSAVKTAKINDGAITNAKLGDSSVTTAKIQNGAVTTAKIEDEGVSTAKIENLAVTTAKIDTGAVTSNKLAESSVTGTKINDGAVSYNKLASALKNLIDGKASQSDLETLQTAVNGKQDKIDSTHKLDADLVDDSTSTNKFVTSAEKTKISNSADVTANNTFTGDNKFDKPIQIYNSTNDDYLSLGTIDMDGDIGLFIPYGSVDNTLAVYFEYLIDKDDDISLKDKLADKQNKLYHHKISIGFTYNSKNGKVNIDLYCTKSTSMTKEDVYNYITNNGNNSVNELNCNGVYDDNILTYITFTDGVDTTDANWNFIEELEFMYIDNGAIATDTITGIYSNNVQYVYDSVIEVI